MKCYEYQAKEIFKKYGIPVPNGIVVDKLNQIKNAFEIIGFPAVIKAQVLAGGRGKAGGINFVDSLKEGQDKAKELFGSIKKGIKVEKLLIEKKIDIKNEYYLGIITDRDSCGPIVIVSSMGGMDVEGVANGYPEKICRELVDYYHGLNDYQARHLVYSSGIKKEHAEGIVSILKKLYILYKECDAELTEINPLIVDQENSIFAADGRLNVDDSALFRQPALKLYKEDTLENRLDEEARIKYIDIGGDIGIISTGAGMTMAVMDQVIAHGGKPANFLDGGLGLLDKATQKALELFMLRGGVNVILYSTYTGIRGDAMAQKLVDAIENTPGFTIPVVVRFQGLNQEIAERILRNSRSKYIHIAHTIDESAKMAVEIAGRGK